MKRIKTLEVTKWVYMVSQFCEHLEDQQIVYFLGKFHHIFCHEFLILKTKLRDLNLRLGGHGICASEIYFSIFLENNEGKRLK